MDIDAYTNRKIIYDNKKTGLSLAHAIKADAMPIYMDMRESDKFECAIWNLDPFDALIKPLVNYPKETYTVLINKKPVALCGTCPAEDNNGIIWGLGTNDITKNYISWIKSSKDVVDIMQNKYNFVRNIIPISNTKSMAWLNHCGFLFEDKTFFEKNVELVQFFRCNVVYNRFNNQISEPVMH